MDAGTVLGYRWARPTFGALLLVIAILGALLFGPALTLGPLGGR